MKAILVIDMPKDCWDCHLVDEWENCNAIKITSERYGVSVKQNDKERPSWCPLKPLPPKLDANDWHRMFSGLFSEREAKGHGWNACLKEITDE